MLSAMIIDIGIFHREAAAYIFFKFFLNGPADFCSYLCGFRDLYCVVEKMKERKFS